MGLASTEFKARLAVHKTSFKDNEKCQTSLSKHIHELKSQNIVHSVTWKTIDRGAPFSPVSNVCNLCTKEKYQILFSKIPLLNSRNEIYSHCRHKQSVLLIPKPRKKKKSHGWILPWELINFLHFSTLFAICVVVELVVIVCLKRALVCLKLKVAKYIDSLRRLYSCCIEDL